MRRYATELIGSFFLVFTICTVSLGGSALAPFAIGGVLAVMVYAGGHVSGAHYNPAVTLAVLIRGRISLADVPGYIAAQVAGALLGAGAGRFVAGTGPEAAFAVSGSALGQALVAELLFTFALAYVVINVATSKDSDGNSFYGLAIGGTVLVGALTVGGISGGVFNPAVAVGVSTVGLISWSMLWVYLVANLVAGAAAGLTFRALNRHDLAPAEAPAQDEAVPSLPQQRTGAADEQLNAANAA
jgi:aquaporin Z